MEIRFLLFFFSVILFSFVPSQLFSNEIVKEKAVLLKNNKTIYAEYIEAADYIFIRNDLKGQKIQKSEIQEIVSLDYFKKIQNGSPWKSATDSLLYFNSSAEYQWNPDSEMIFKENLIVRFLKIGLLFTTGYFYNETLKANDNIQKSFLGFSSSAERQFSQNYQNYQISATLTLVTFSISTINAYIRFGRNSNYEDLNISGRTLLSVDEYVNSKDQSFLIKPQNNVELFLSKAY